MWNLRYGIKKPNSKQKQTYKYRDQTYAKERRQGQRWTGNIGLADGNYYIQNGKTENYVQSPEIKQNGKEY